MLHHTFTLKKIDTKIRFFILFLFGILGLQSFGFAFSIPGENPNKTYEILNQSEEEILTPMENDTWRDGARDAIASVNNDGIEKTLIASQDKISTQQEAHKKVIASIWRFVNYALSFVSLIAFVILIFAGVKMLLGAGDDKAQGAGKAALLKVVKAIGGLALSWAIISLIFWVISSLV